MKRNLDIVRSILLKLEELKHGPSYYLQPPYEGQFGDFSDEDVAYHLSLLLREDYVDGPRSQPAGGIGFTALTWKGHDFLDATRDNDVWAKTKAGASSVKGWTVDLLLDLAKGFLKKQVEDRTGIKL
jgi:hypothetical protein